MTPMTPAPLDFHPMAIAEARAARRRYARRSGALAIRFLAELDRAVAEIARAPDQWPPHLHGTRVFRLRRFPFLVIYDVRSGSARVVALAHTSRRPGYWRRRLP